MKRVALILFAASACVVQTGGRQAQIVTDTGLSTAEYDVYTYMLGTVGTAEYKIVADSTIRRPRPQRSVCRRAEQSDCVPSSSSVTAAWHDYLEKNENPRKIDVRFPENLHVTMEHERLAGIESCHTPTRISFSRVGFSPSHTHAVVTMAIRTGKGPYPGCGGTSLMTVVLERQRDKWRRVAYIESLES